jgi:hypothetical protein
MMKLLARAVLPVVAGGFLLAGCTSTQAGTASPAGSPAGTPSSAPETSSSSGAGQATTASLQPCTVLAASDLSGYGSFKDAIEKNDSDARTCTYQKKTESASDEGLVVSVVIRDNAGLDETNDTGGGVQDVHVNGRKAKVAPSPAPTGCVVVLGVGDKARVDVTVSAVSTVDKACQIAGDVADKSVEPKLPKG